MDSITLGQIAVGLAFILALISGIASLKKSIKTWIEAAMKERFDSIDRSQKEILKRLGDVDLENCKNYLITFLSEIARGENKDEIEIKRFWEEYSHYVENGGNSYIKHKVEELNGKGIL